MEKNNKFEKVAIVGMGALLPGASTLGEFWHNILSGKDCIEEVPEAFWHYQDYYDADPFTRDKTYCKRGGFLPPVQFDCLEFGIPPSVLESISLNQLLALKVAKDAMIDARMLGDNQIAYDKTRTGVILGANLGGSAFPLRERITLPRRMQDMLTRYGVDSAIIENVVGDIQDGYIDWNENSFPGFLTNIVSGRIVNRFDFGGPNFTVDAACASSLCAMMQAIYELQSGQCDQVLTGGVNVSNDPLSYMSFSKTPALSLKNKIRPYDKQADGMLVGDGIGMMVLMRLEDAEARGHRIYSVISGLGSASDGKAKSIYAPRVEGQLLALNRAYANSDVTPEQIALVEGHGTGTPVGDACEVSGLKQYFGQHKLRRQSIALGSVKSQIGHTTQAAGAASAIKVALALYHRVIPPTINVEEPNPDYELQNSPFYLNVEPIPWIHNQPHTRCAAVSSFGFGGINYHLLLEEYAGKDQPRWKRQNDLPLKVLLSAPDARLLKQKCVQLLEKLDALTEFESDTALLNAFGDNSISEAYSRVGFVAENTGMLREKLNKTIAALADNQKDQWQLPGGIFYRSKAAGQNAKVVAMFSGQGAQYPDMGKSIALNYPEMHAAFAEVDQALEQQGKSALTPILFAAGTDAAHRSECATMLNRTEYVQPALAAFCAGTYDLLTNIGFKPDLMLGHSFGELTSLWASGAISRVDFFRLSVARGHAMQVSRNPNGDSGAMLAVAKPPPDLARLVTSFPDIQVANFNSPEQRVLSGATDSICQIEELLDARNVKVVRLPVSGAFHSPHMADAVEIFSAALKQTAFKAPEMPVYSNLTATVYDKQNQNLTTVLSDHLMGAVRFEQSIEAAYSDGGRIFIEIGPKSILSNFAESTLRGKDDVSIITVNPSPKKDGVFQLLEALVQLQVLGVALRKDPYESNETAGAASLKEKKSAVVARLHGRHYFSQESLVRINRAGSAFGGASEKQVNRPPMVQEKSTNVVPELIQIPKSEEKVMEPRETESASSLPVQSTTTAIGHGDRSAISINDVLQCQASNSQVQNLFYHTQAQQLNVLEKLMQHQQSVMQQVVGAGNVNGDKLHEVGMQHAQTFESLCQHSQSLFATHDAFLSNQNAILSRLLGEQGTALRQADLPRIVQPVRQLPHTNVQSVNIAPALATAVKQPAAVAVPELKPVNRPAPAVVSEQAVSGDQATHAQVSVQPIALDAEKFVANLLQVVSSATGYPAEVIDLDMNLEADLGIDSIKRVEIFSVLNDQYPDYSDQIDIGDLAALTTLQEILDYFANLTSEATAATSASENPQPMATPVVPVATPSVSSTSASHMTVEHFSRLLVETIVSATGYPADVIDFDMDLEADLGVDSIKRVEMFAALQDQYEDLISDLDPSDLMELKSLQQITDFFARRFDNVKDPLEQHDTIALTLRSDGAALWADTNLASDDTLPLASVQKKKELDRTAARYHVRANPVAMPLVSGISFTGHHVVITEDNQGNGKAIYQYLKARGARATLVRFAGISAMESNGAEEECDDVVDVAIEELTDSTIATLLAGITAARGGITGFVHMNPVFENRSGLAEFLAESESLQIRAVFFMAKHLKRQLAKKTQGLRNFFTTVVRIDGMLGCSDSRPGSIIQGGYCGLVKSLKMEAPDLFCRCVDIGPDIGSTEVVEIVLQELSDGETELLETGRPGADSRYELVKALAEIPKRVNNVQPDKNSVFLVSGGGRGVTARCVERLASEYQCGFIIIGRTPMGAAEPEWAKGCEEETALRKALLNRTLQQQEKVVPAQIDRVVKKLMTQRELQQTVDNIQKFGGRVSYISEDIVNAESVIAKVQFAESELGPITGVVHGAGNIADKLLEFKEEHDFDLVYGSKVRSLVSLLACVDPNRLQHLILFSSISGFYGQFGQSDYSLSNEILNKFALMASRDAAIPVVCSINWGPWDGGMVSTALKNIYAKFNVNVMPIEEGVQYFIDEFHFQDQSGGQILVCPKNIDEVRSRLSTREALARHS